MKSYWLGRISEGFAPNDVFSAGREVETNRERPVCEKHNPDYSVGVGADGKPRKPSGFCLECAAELAQKRRHTGAETEVVPSPRTMTFDFGQDTERVQKALNAHTEREANRPGHVVPGSVEETRALEIIADRRAEDRDAERRRSGRGGVFLFSRIERGDLISYYDVRSSLKERPQLVRVGP
jgi:hypothetical protein